MGRSHSNGGGPGARSGPGDSPKARRRGREDEPDLRDLLGGDIEEWGGELWFAAGHTSGGAPYGVRLAELERDEAATSGSRWARAKRLLQRAFVDDAPEVGRVRYLGEGLARTAWVADVVAGSFAGAAVVLLPHDDVDDTYAKRVRRECRILAALARADALPFRVARPLALLIDDDRPVLVEEFARGIPLDMRSGRGPRPWRVIGQAAAAVHALNVDVPGPSTRREVALAAIAGLEAHRRRHAAVADALDFAMAALPDPTRPTSFIHGDLLGQNILWSPDNEPPTLIDFENAERGDPAQELAIVTRGVRRPFGVEGGLAKLLDEYAASAGHEVRAIDVHLYEALLLAGQVVSYLRCEPLATPPMLQTLVSLLRRV
ncbi:MAG: aminoglycoside phosphotransferase family protein [Deltaproteobacteria bacterium]|nr:aminoglycoside phosphotransferase family protein [Deltaproteobacteria bacterium]